MTRHALLIGISDYRDSKIGALKKSANDVEALARVLSDVNRGNFSVTSLINCTKREAERAVATLTQKRVHGETILLYFSGHGIRDDDCNLYLALSDTESDALMASAIFAPNLCFMLDKSLANEQLVILDCCHSGAFSKDAKATLGDSVGTKEIFIREGRGRVVLTASDETSFAWEGGRQIGDTTASLFTHHIVRGIETGEADLEGDTEIDTDELYRYVYREVVRDRPDQRPLKFGQAQQGKLIISRAPVVVRPLPDAVLSAINSPFTGVRIGIVETLENRVQHGSPSERISAFAALRSLARDDSREVSAVATGALKRNAPPPGFIEEQSERLALTPSAVIPPPSIAAPPVPPPEPAPPLPAQPPDAAKESAPAAVGSPIENDADNNIENDIDEDGLEDRPGQLLKPSVLDRLIDVSPSERYDPTSTKVGALRQGLSALRRDIVHLLNSVVPLPETPAGYDNVRGSVLNYGLPEIQPYDFYSAAGHHRIAKLLAQVFRDFEPRLGKVQVTILPGDSAPSGPRFQIEARVQVDPEVGAGASSAAVLRMKIEFEKGRVSATIG